MENNKLSDESKEFDINNNLYIVVCNDMKWNETIIFHDLDCALLYLKSVHSVEPSYKAKDYRIEIFEKGKGSWIPMLQAIRKTFNNEIDTNTNKYIN